MNKFLMIVIAILVLPMISGCYVVKQAGYAAVEGGIEAIESKVVELRGKEARETIAAAIDAGLKETDADPNLDGTIDWEEWKAYQVKVQTFVVSESIKKLASGESVAEVKAWAISKEEALGLGSIPALLLTLALNAYRTRTRKKDIKEGVERRAPEFTDDTDAVPPSS